MKTVMLLLTTLVVAIAPAQALRCHVCSDSGNCKGEQYCPANAKQCKTTILVNTLSGNRVSKECVEWCVPSKDQQQQMTDNRETVYCCSGDLCNSRLQNAAPLSSPLTSTLGLALGLLSLLLVSNL